MSNTKTIARNTGWYGLESAIGSIVTVFTSIAIARTLGPAKMGYIIYVTWIASMVGNLGGFGVTATTRKYMAEFLGMGDRATARHIYIRTWVFQSCVATVATCVVLFWVLRDANADYRVAATLVVLSIWPAMVNSVSAQANVAAEELSANLPGSVASIFTFFVVVVATLVFKWGVVGIGAAILAMRMTDFLVRFFPTARRILSWEKAQVRPTGLSARMMMFAWQSIASMVVALVVWERSEFVLLRYLCSDIRQIAFYSVAFSLADRLMIGSAVFGSATGATIFAQYGRDKSRLPALTASTFRYLAISSIPLHFIAAALAGPALLLLYGRQYSGAVAVVTLAPLLCMPKAFMGPIQNLLQSMERQSYVIAATVTAGLVRFWSRVVCVIPRSWRSGRLHWKWSCPGHSRGTDVTVGIVFPRLRLPWMLVVKTTGYRRDISLTRVFRSRTTATGMGRTLWGKRLPLVVLFGLFYLMRVLEPVDRARLNILVGMLPASMRGLGDRILSLLIRPAFSSVTPAEARTT